MHTRGGGKSKAAAGTKHNGYEYNHAKPMNGHVDSRQKHKGLVREHKPNKPTTYRTKTNNKIYLALLIGALWIMYAR